MQNKKNIILILLLSTQGQYIIADRAKEIAQAMQEAANIKAEALKEAAPLVGLEAAKILSAAFLGNPSQVSPENTQVSAQVHHYESTEYGKELATSQSIESSYSFIDTTQKIVSIIKGLIAIGALSACVCIAWAKISRYSSSKKI